MDVLIVLLLIGAIVYLLLKNKDSTKSNIRSIKKTTFNKNIILPYKKRQYFFSKAERSFYEVLLLALKDNNYTVFSKVRLLDLFYLPKNTNKPQTHINKIQSKHVDFVICDSQSLKTLLAIELDDSSHLNLNRMERDEFINDIFKQAQFPLLRIPAKASYSVQELKNQIREAIMLETVTPEIKEPAEDTSVSS